MVIYTILLAGYSVVVAVAVAAVVAVAVVWFSLFFGVRW